MAVTEAGEPPRGARIAVSTYFLVLGITSAVWVARIPAVKERLALSDGQLGIALLAVPVGLMLGTLAAGHLVDRFGSGPMTRVAGVVTCLLLLAPGIAGSMAGLMVALLATGIAGGTLDVSMNSHGVRVETAYRRPVMASMHACYSLGGFAGALFGGAFAWAGIGPEPAFIAAGLPAAAVAAGAGRWLSGLPAPAPDAPGRPARPARGIRLPPPSRMGRSPERRPRRRMGHGPGRRMGRLPLHGWDACLAPHGWDAGRSTDGTPASHGWDACLLHGWDACLLSRMGRLPLSRMGRRMGCLPPPVPAPVVGGPPGPRGGGGPGPAGSSSRSGSSGCAAWSERGRPATGAPSTCTTTWARRPAWPPSGTACSRS